MSNVQGTRTAAPAPARPALAGTLLADGAILRLLVIVVLLFVVFSLLRPDAFPLPRNLQSMAFQASEIGILAIAVALTMLSGGIDLSINSTANLSAIIAGTILTSMAMPDAPGGQAALAIVLASGAALLVGLACGFFNGILVARIGIPPILATLGTLTLFRGIGTVITKGAAVFAQDRLVTLGNGELVGIPVPLIILLLVALVVGIIVTRTRFGFELYMLGSNPTAARFSGIDNTSVLMRTYILSGLLSALAGLVILGRTNAARVDFGESYILLAIMICVLGGIDPAGGAGRIFGVLLAVIALQFLSTGLNMVLFENPGANFFKQFAWGATLLVVLLLNYFAGRRRRRPAGEA